MIYNILEQDECDALIGLVDTRYFYSLSILNLDDMFCQDK